MNTRAKQVLYSPVDIDDADFSDFNREPTEDELEFQKFRDEFKQSNEYAKVSCYRQPTTSDGRPGQKSLTFLFESGVEEFSFSQLAGRLRDEYGSGTYRIQLRDKGGVLKMNRAIAIEAPKNTDIVANPTTGIMESFSRAMAEQQNRTEALIREISGPRNPVDFIDQFSKLAIAVGPILASMGIGQNNQPAPKTLVEQLTEFKMIKELFGGGDDEAMGGEANLYSLLGETIKAFGGPLAAALAAGAKAGDLDPDGLATTGHIALPAPETEKVMTEEKHKMEMRKNIHILIQNAKTGIPPASFALILVNNTPDEKQDALWDFISSETCVDEIIKIEPAAARYKEWFSNLRDEVINLLSDPESDDENSDLPESESGSSLAANQSVAGVDDTESETASDPDDSDTPTNT